jgi:UDP-glucose 4-epimerase
MLDKIELAEDLEIHGDGNQIFDFIEVSDVARANLCAMKSLQGNGFYNVGRGVGTSLKELAELLIVLTGSSCKISYKSSEQNLVTKRIGATSKAEQEINFKWSIDLRDGLLSLIKYRNML